MALPRVPTESSNEKQHRTVIATTVNELAKTRPPFDQTAAEAAAGVTPLNYEYPPGPSGGHIFRFIPRDQHQDILDGTSTYDATADIQRCIDSLKPGDTITIAGYPKAIGLTLTTSDITFAGAGWIVPYSNTASAVLTIGDDATDTDVKRFSGHLRIGDTSTNHTSYTNVTGLKLVRCTEATAFLDITACNVGLDFAPTESAVAYNHFFLGMIYNNKIGIRFNPSSTGYSNENKFFGGRFGQGLSLSGIGIVGVQGTTNGGSGGAPDQNIFYSPTFELAGRAVDLNGPDMCRFHDVRFEPKNTDLTAGTDFEEELIVFGSNSTRCSFEISMNPEIFTGGRGKDHGNGTRSNDFTFTIAGDLTKWFYPGAIVQLTVTATVYNVFVRSSSVAAGTTTVILHTPVITANPTSVTTPRITNAGTGHSIRIDRFTDSTLGFDLTHESHSRRTFAYERSAFIIQAMDADHPALTLLRGSADTNRVLRAMDSTGETAYLQANGTLSVASLSVGGLSATNSASGTYTPTLTNTTNLDASTPYEAQYMRVGNTVTVSGRVDADPTAAALTQLRISLPVASNLGANEDLAGVAFSPDVAGQGAAIRASATADTAIMEWTAVDTSNRAMYYTFTYAVI
jgi:hypothetical protein